MKPSDPSIQDRVHGAVNNAADDAIAAVEPLLTAPNTILWLVFAGALLVFLLIIYLIMRGRVASAQRYAEAADAKFFQPAGEEAEITFEDEPGRSAKQLFKRAGADEEPEEEIAEVVIEHPDDPGGTRFDEPRGAAGDEDEGGRSKRGVMSSFFSRIRKRDQEREEREEPDDRRDVFVEANGLLDDEQEFEIDRSDPFAKMRGSLEFESDEAPSPEEPSRLEAEREAVALKRRAEEEAEAIRRRAEEDARRLQREAEDEARRRRASEDARREAEREAELERRRLALASEPEPRREPSQVDFERALSRELDDRFAALQERLERQVGERRSDETGPDYPAAPAFATRPGDFPGDGGLDAIDKRLAEHREFVDKSLSAMARQLDQLAGAPNEMEALRSEIADLRGALRGGAQRGTGAPTAPTVQLGDIVRNALPPDAYEMNAILPNNRKADCLVRLPKPPGPVAIDARFPVEAYAKLQRALAANDNDQHAENEFRRVTLRHVVDIAERLILAEETAESALMFLPSESIYTELHSRFPDVVQDSYRARVWIVSPTTLMATLHTIRAIVRDAHVRENASFIQSEAEHVLDEVDSLRRRVYSLEETFDRTRSDVREVISSTDQVYRRAETITRGSRPFADDRLARVDGQGVVAHAPATGSPAPGALATTGASSAAGPAGQRVSPRREGEDGDGPGYGQAARPSGRPGGGFYSAAPHETKQGSAFPEPPREAAEADADVIKDAASEPVEVVEAERVAAPGGEGSVFPLR